MTSPAKILLVDDDHDFVEATRIVLESAPYDVAVAYDGEEALHKVREVAPDLIILDVIMPEQHGFKVCEALKSDPDLSGIPVIMLTSLSQQMGETAFSLTDGMMLEADDYVDKPVTPQELLRRVQKFLEKGKT
ncbi:MAG TPA: response regulator [Anaerolineae bacterium]|jgi:two-component system alkaline phosphatase synthesis response regulator PhoP|nr:response regulator [Anaerolineae bacterium]